FPRERQSFAPRTNQAPGTASSRFQLLPSFSFLSHRYSETAARIRSRIGREKSYQHGCFHERDAQKSVARHHVCFALLSCLSQDSRGTEPPSKGSQACPGGYARSRDAARCLTRGRK